MTEQAVAGSDASPPAAVPIDAFLLDHIRANPGSRHGRLVQAVRAQCRVSRSTAASHLARLLRFGDVVRLPDRTYIVRDAATPATDTIVEFHREDSLFYILPDGGTRVFILNDFRVVSGQLDYYEFGLPRPAREVLWRSTAPGGPSRTPAIFSSDRHSKYRFEFSPSLTSRGSTIQRICVSMLLSRWFRMAHDPGQIARGVRPGGDPRWESEWFQFSSRGERYRSRLSEDAYACIQVALPEGYPVGALRHHVHYLNEPHQVDSREELRLGGLRKGSEAKGGLLRSGSTFHLSVPRPVVDRRYELAWSLPTSTQRRRWLVGHHRREEG